ncbi:metallophosphoesterase [Carboxylicivirga marina]|uniref:Metallophosphoesterase n=1 Tax=Carboxylicivirga marina TaxID=2800988 RepID=A0ABS1HJW2_9BACT|nr:metallophosphoesterase [Carboxylicivirga marina]MBK3517964.1 metallophosphoesterase [Carboxylicivirga marina]
MTVQYCSDLHLEFARNSDFIIDNPIKPIGDILILAGDITFWEHSYHSHSFFDDVSEKFESVYYVPGNHEFYAGKDLKIIDEPVQIPIRKNVFLVNNITIKIGEVDFFFTMLWSHIIKEKANIIEQGVGDFHRIKYHRKKLNSDVFNLLHKRSLQFLKQAITKSSTDKKVVVTHHIPTQKCNPEYYKDSDINSAFVSEQETHIENWGIDYWIYGHHHANMPETTINGTSLVTNQLGYIDWGEQENFRNNACFQI